MMDSLPGIRMSGENNNALGAISLMFGTILGDKPHLIMGQQKKVRGGVIQYPKAPLPVLHNA